MSNEHKCVNTQVIRKLEIDLAVAQSDITKVKQDITDIKESISRFNWWFIGVLVTVIGSMAMILYNIKG